MRLTIAKLRKLNASEAFSTWFQASGCTTVEETVAALLASDLDDRYEWSNWLLPRVLDNPNRIRYAVYAAKLALPFFEAAYPHDKRPRNAIEAAKKCIESIDSAPKAAAWDATWDASVAASAASRANSSAAASAAWAAAWAARAAASDAASAASAAARDAARYAARAAASDAVKYAARAAPSDAVKYAAWAAARAAIDAAWGAAFSAAYKPIIRHGLTLVS
jgi:hypothetical protein